VLAAVMVAVAVGLQLPALYPQLSHHVVSFPPSPTIADMQAWELTRGPPGLTVFNEFRPIWRTEPFSKQEAALAAASPIANLPRTSRVVRDERRNGHWNVTVEGPTRFNASFHLLYFPGWAAYVDGQRRTLKPTDGTGYARVDVPAGSHTIDLKYEGTTEQQVAALVSGLAVVLLALAAFLWRGKKEEVSPVEYPLARWWVPAGLLLFVALKALWLDPHTTFMRWASSCEAIHGAEVHTDVRFGESLRLCGFSLPRMAFKPGDEVSLTMYWETSRMADEPTRSFVHLLGSRLNPETNNPLWGQHDKELPGRYPVNEWEPGKLYRDTYQFRIDSHTPPGEYQLEIGWWQPSSGRRLRPHIDRPNGQLSVSDLDALLLSGIVVDGAAR
jgi:hypothetical protein